MTLESSGQSPFSTKNLSQVKYLKKNSRKENEPSQEKYSIQIRRIFNRLHL
jgi:hypothetical protein